MVSLEMGIRSRVLVVDDEEPVRRMLGTYLGALTFDPVLAGDAAEAIAYLNRESFDVVLSDVRMPGMDGIDLLDWIEMHAPETPVVILSGCDDVRLAVKAMKNGAVDYIVKPFDLAAVAETLRQAMRGRREAVARAQYLQALERRVDEQAGTIRSTMLQLREASKETLEALVSALDAREHETHAHSKRVSDYSVEIARRLGVRGPELEIVREGSMMHDIGKIGIPDRILLKPGRLSDEEWIEMRKHPQIGAWIVSGVESLRPASEIVIAHHERFDGAGYPNALAGSAIPLGARVFAVADCLDAMLSDRPYRSGIAYAEVRAEIARNAGSQFDPDVVRCFLETPPERWHEIREDTLQKPGPALVLS